MKRVTIWSFTLLLTLMSLSAPLGADDSSGDHEGTTTTEVNYGDSHGPSELEDIPPTTTEAPCPIADNYFEDVGGCGHGPDNGPDAYPTTEVPEATTAAPTTTTEAPEVSLVPAVSILNPKLCYQLPKDEDTDIVEIPCPVPAQLAVTGVASLTASLLLAGGSLVLAGMVARAAAGKEQEE